MKNETHYYRIADFTISVSFHECEWVGVKKKLISDITHYLKEYEVMRITAPPDWNIEIVWDNSFQFLFFKGEKTNYISLYKYKNRNSTTTYYRIGLFEFQLVLSRILSILLRQAHGFFLHASAIRIRDGVNIFIGPSGAGKSTTVKLLSKDYPVMADDFIIIRKVWNAFYFYKTPFLDKENIMKKKRSVFQNVREKQPIGRIFFLKKSQENKIVKIKNGTDIQAQILRSAIDIMGNLSKDSIATISDFMRKHGDFSYLFFKNNRAALVRMFRESDK